MADTRKVVFLKCSYKIPDGTIKKSGYEKWMRVKWPCRAKMLRLHAHGVRWQCFDCGYLCFIGRLTLCGALSHHSEGEELPRMDAIGVFSARYNRSLNGEASAHGEARTCYCSLRSPLSLCRSFSLRTSMASYGFALRCACVVSFLSQFCREWQVMYSNCHF